jgi:hypothetical protein
MGFQVRLESAVFLGVWFLVASPLTGLAGETETEITPMKKQRRILYNNDGASVIFLKAGGQGPSDLTEADLRRAVDEVTDSGSLVDTWLICINAQVMFYPSKAGTMVGFLVTAEKRKPLPPGVRQWMANLEGFYAKGVDPYALMIDQARKKKIEVLLSFRMNDAHVSDFLRCRLWVDHPEYRLNSPKDSALNFGIEAVRDYTFELIREAVQRYDVDGLELDFNRFPNYFKGGTEKENIAKMTRLVERVRQTLDEEGGKRKKRLVLAVRVPESLAKCRSIGLDPVAWNNGKLIEFLTASHFFNGDPQLPVKEFKEALPGIPIYSCIEYDAKHEFGPSPDYYRKAAANRWATGADGIYLFNFFCHRESGYGVKPVEPPFEVLRELGDPKSIGAKPAKDESGGNAR